MTLLEFMDWINVVMTPIILVIFWPNLDKLGPLAFLIVPIWAAMFWIDCLQSELSKEYEQ